MAGEKRIPANLPGGGRPGWHRGPVEHAADAGTALKRLLKYFAWEKRLLLGMLIIVLLGTVCGVVAPALQSGAIDILSGTAEGAFVTTLLLMLGAYLLYSAAQLGQGLISASLSQRIVKRMRQELFEKIVELPVPYMDQHSHGDIMSRMTNDIENISTTVSQSLPSLCSGVLTIVGTMLIMFYYCPILTVLSYGTVLLTVFASQILSRSVRKYSRERQTYLGELNGMVEEMVSGYRTISAYNRQKEVCEEFCGTSDALTKAGIWTDALSGVMGPISNCIGNIGFVIIAAFGGYFAIRGMISIGVISAFIVYAKQFSRPINELAQIYGQLQTAVAGAERVFAVLDEASETTDGVELNISDERKAEIRFEHVNFSYVPGTPVLRDVSLTVPAGKKVALVGATGSGKTTLANLLLHFYEVDSGVISINGQNIRDIQKASLRKQEAIVLQDTVLFSGTIRSNLTYAGGDMDEESLQRAVEMSHCGTFIAKLPEGYDTRLSSSGENISQGQRQLLAIARAFLMDPNILILDEATSNVDTRTEKAIQNAMQNLMQDRTSIVIAHRLSTIRDADIIVVLDHGQIVEQGSHEELLEQKGKYYELYMTQYAGIQT